MARIAISYIGELESDSFDCDVLVDGDLPYVEACRVISAAIRDNGDVEVGVRSKSHFTWFRSFISQLAVDANFTEKTARSLLSERWKTAVPDWVSDSDIMSQQLLHLDGEARAQRSFESCLLSWLLGPAFDADTLDSQNAAQVVTSCADDRYRRIVSEYPIVVECLKRKSTQWQQSAQERWIREICHRLPDDPSTPWRWLSAASILKNYPDELLERILPIDQVATVRRIPAEGADNVALEPSIRDEALAQITALFADVGPKVNSNADFLKIVQWVSGLLMEEFQLVSKVLRSGTFDPTSEDVELVESTFRSCPGVRRSQLVGLRHVVRPQYPTLMAAAETWDADQWIRWTVHEYAPYREWQIRNSEFDARLEETVLHFSDWYVDSYVAIHADINRGLSHCLSTLNTSEGREGLTVVLIVDCLPVSYAPLMDEALRSSGFRSHDLNYRYAALPTVTEYNKGALLAGTAGVRSKSYEAVLSERANQDWDGTETSYLGTLNALTDLQPNAGASIVVVNHTESDDILHSDVNSKNRTYEEELSRTYSQLADATAQLCEKWAGPRESVRILLVTDHGASWVLDEEARTFDSNVVSKLFEDEKHRMATMTVEQADKVPANLWEIGYRFKAPFSSEDAVHFLPRGHNTVKKARANAGYLHGGVSPEEVIVPIATYGLVALSWKKPATRFVNLEMNPAGDRARFYIQRIVKVEIEVQNLDAVPVRVTAIEILSPDCSVKGLKTDTVGVESVATVSIELYFQKAALPSTTLEMKLRYEIRGAEHETIISVPTEFRSAIAGGFNLRDL